MHTQKEGLLVVISGPSGVGKGAIFKGLMQRNPGIKFSVSATTRAPRPGEVDGRDYRFMPVEKFENMITNDEFLEYTNVFGTHYYGTPKETVRREMDAGNDIVLEIDVRGAMNIKRVCSKAVAIFIAPPSMQILKSRLVGRHTETQEAIERRFKRAYEEMKCIEQYDYIVINDVLDTAVSQVESIIIAEHASVCRNAALVKELQGGN
ncbi:MAG: guanylate kinase [Clostridia bacterium]